MRVKPKPCPNCGSKYVEMWTKFFGGNGFEVRCLDCGYIGELGKTRAAAARAWNNDEDEHRCGMLAFIVGAVINSALSILLLLGLEALENLGGI